MPPEQIYFVVGFLLGLFSLVPLGLAWWLFGPWIRAFLSGTPLSIFQVLGARLRGSPVELLIDALVAIRQGDRADLAKTTFADLERLYLQHRHRIAVGDDLVRLVRDKVTTT